MLCLVPSLLQFSQHSQVHPVNAYTFADSEVSLHSWELPSAGQMSWLGQSWRLWEPPEMVACLWKDYIPTKGNIVQLIVFES